MSVTASATPVPGPAFEENPGPWPPESTGVSDPEESVSNPDPGEPPKEAKRPTKPTTANSLKYLEDKMARNQWEVNVRFQRLETNFNKLGAKFDAVLDMLKNQAPRADVVIPQTTGRREKENAAASEPPATRTPSGTDNPDRPRDGLVTNKRGNATSYKYIQPE